MAVFSSRDESVQPTSSFVKIKRTTGFSRYYLQRRTALVLKRYFLSSITNGQFDTATDTVILGGKSFERQLTLHSIVCHLHFIMNKGMKRYYTWHPPDSLRLLFQQTAVQYFPDLFQAPLQTFPWRQRRVMSVKSPQQYSLKHTAIEKHTLDDT